MSGKAEPAKQNKEASIKEGLAKAGLMKLRIRWITGSESVGIFLILILLCVALWIVRPETFPTSDNLLSVARQFSYIAIAAIGELMVIITNGIDLSVGSIMGFGAVLTGFLMHEWMTPVPVAIILGLVGGGLFGLLNAFFITKLHLPPFIATLGTLSIGRGIAYAITKGYTVPTPDAFAAIGQGYWGLIPLPVIYMVVIGVIFAIFLGQTVTGRRIYALGGNEEAAIVSGINANRIKCLVYVLSGVLAAVGGIICAARLGVAQSTLGLGYELDVIAAVYIGGASANGGSGTVLGAIVGAAIMGIIRNGLVLLDVSPYWVQTAIGSVIVIAVAIDQLRASYQQKQQLKEVKEQA